MAPMMLDSLDVDSTSSKLLHVCSDSTVVPPGYTSQRIKDLWWLHGHPHSRRYSNAKLVSLGALVRHDGTVFKGKKAFLYPVLTDSNTTYESMTWDAFDRITETLALFYAERLRDELENSNLIRVQPTVALLGTGTTLEYFCTELALQKLGVRVLLLAESNAKDALHHLLEACSAVAVITDSKNSKVNTNDLEKIDMVEVLPQSFDVNYEDLDAVKFQDFGDIWERHTFIIHSSGSTGMPKPVIHTNRSMMLIARMYRLFQEFSAENWFLLFPLYHIAGISIALSGLPNGQILSFPPLVWPPSSSGIFAAWETLSSMGNPVDLTHCAPTIIENMYEFIKENGGDFSPLASLKVLQPGGAALSERIVTALTANGVNVKTTYGSTEIGPPFRSIPHTRNNPKCYSFRNLFPDNPLLEMQEVAEGSYECVVHKGFELAAELWQNTNEPYRTNDLFIQDPPGSGFFVLIGRKDDILVHSNGENTSAGPLQLDIQTSSKYINTVLALGHSKPCVSLLVELHEKYDPESDDIRAEVWNTVRAINPKYPGHSQIMESMVRLLPKGEKLPVTPKGNVKRKEVMNLYAKYVDQFYSEYTSPPTPRTSSSGFSHEAVGEYIRNILASISNTHAADIHDWTTLYDLGVNSRLALSLKATLTSQFNRPISLSTIFENPSISKLTAYFTQPSSRSITPPPSEQVSSIETVHRIMSKLESEFGSWPSRATMTFPAPAKETILLTGSSGSLGTALLATLSGSSQVEKVYAMVRGPNHFAKLEKALGCRGMDLSILEKGSKVEVVNFSMQDPLLGLDLEKYSELANSVTVVVQNAWKMDFNLGVEEFEGDCLRNTMSLLRFCQAGRPKRLAFTSSISTCMGPGHIASTVPEAPIGPDPTVALSTGYAQSKYIVERITQTAAKTLRLPIHLLRVGQLAGSTHTGCWNVDEMWPIIFSTSLHPLINCIPSFPSKLVDWIPVDIAAATISDILLSPSSSLTTPTSTSPSTVPSPEKNISMTYNAHNIVNPYPVPWRTVLSYLDTATHTSLQRVPMKEWVQKLSMMADSPFAEEIHGLRLLRFFEEMAAAEDSATDTNEGGAGDDRDQKGKVLMFETEKTRGISKALRECGPFCGEWIERNVRVWRESGFLKK
ncbi:hypothetical protein HYALB_00013133 [Hymenoscyphus albidus]|uniref:Carrier domain-containing protein n=1 Tax=Hymenoscyphus albidus TaxID=595503 RepID=A0A9N9LUQ5_9HELO|nr:hypothetical protein HYALB_00013133 [Hymenoscyphus albidus]